MRERIYYQKEQQTVLYEKANAKYHNCRDEVTDNLVKQAKTICKPTAEEFKKYFDIFKLDDQVNLDGDDITSRIPYLKATEYHQKWLKIQSDHRAKMLAIEKKKNN